MMTMKPHRVTIRRTVYEYATVEVIAANATEARDNIERTIEDSDGAAHLQLIDGARWIPSETSDEVVIDAEPV